MNPRGACISRCWSIRTLYTYLHDKLPNNLNNPNTWNTGILIGSSLQVLSLTMNSFSCHSQDQWYWTATSEFSYQYLICIQIDWPTNNFDDNLLINTCTSTAIAMWAKGMSSFLTLISDPVNRHGLRVGRVREEQGRLVNCFSAMPTSSSWFTPAMEKKGVQITTTEHHNHLVHNNHPTHALYYGTLDTQLFELGQWLVAWHNTHYLPARWRSLLAYHTCTCNSHVLLAYRRRRFLSTPKICL